ncbi:MAG: hypothetical protein HY372_00205 [Candidatus Andersenbacteria bacterium]|nr:hypothetical protein [Candidatus Andersenbacteria bacterium]
MIAALLEANQAMLDTSIADAIASSHTPYKGDTLGLDQRPENTITKELMDYDQYAVIITEERGQEANPLASATPETVFGARTFFGCDPCDRSAQLRSFLAASSNHKKRVGDVIRQRSTIHNWASQYGQPAPVTGANAALTCVRRGLPFGTVLLNYITQEVTLACSAGVFHTGIPKGRHALTLDDLCRQRRLTFTQPGRDHYRMFVTFIGKPERGYPQNFAATKLVAPEDMSSYLHYGEPGGPTRILYLTELQNRRCPIGLIIANGEKIGEWIHWLPFIRFSHREDDHGEKALSLFEITQEKTDFRDGYMMSPTANYSIFRQTHDGTVTMDVDALRRLDNPSKYRGSFLVTSAGNKYAISLAQQHGYRELRFPPSHS